MSIVRIAAQLGVSSEVMRDPHSSPLSPLGKVLEDARTTKEISGREAGRRAGISATRWRQVVAGDVPPARTIAVMALAVDADPEAALMAAGIKLTQDEVAKLIADTRLRAPARPNRTDAGGGLAVEIERVKGLPITPSEKIRLARALIDMYEEQAREPAT